MTREIVIANQVLVVSADGHFRVADISDMVPYLMERDSIRPALEAYFHKHGMRLATPDEATRSGFPTRERRLDRNVELPRRRFHR